MKSKRRTESSLGVIVLDHQIFRIRRENDLLAVNQLLTIAENRQTHLVLDGITLERLQRSREQSMLLHIFDRLIELVRSSTREVL